MQPDLFTLPQSPKELALARVWTGTSDEWKANAFEAIRELCRTKEEFTADDLAAVAKQTHEPRAIGALLRNANKAGLCAPTDRYQNSTDAKCHFRQKRIWKSLILGV